MRWSLATIVLAPRGGAAAPAGAGDIERVLKWAALAGFTGLELSPHWLNYHDLPPAELTSFRRDVERAGLTISGINLNRCLFTRGPQAAQSLAAMRRAIEVAAVLQAPVATFSLSLPQDATRPLLRGHSIPESERQQAALALQSLAAMAAQNQTTLSLELHDDGLLDSAELCLDMLSRVGAANIGVNPDLGNLVRSQPAADWRSALRQLAPRANNWHVKNYRSGQPAALPDGEIDYTEAVTIMREAGYQGWVSIESYFGDVLALQERSLAYLRRLANVAQIGAEGTAA
jgi:sugar phosphate isomerase/epimerase